LTNTWKYPCQPNVKVKFRQTESRTNSWLVVCSLPSIWTKNYFNKHYC